jgi:hypothetical protein
MPKSRCWKCPWDDGGLSTRRPSGDIREHWPMRRDLQLLRIDEAAAVIELSAELVGDSPEVSFRSRKLNR